MSGPAAASAASWASFGVVIAQVGLGGAAGAICRYLLVRGTERWSAWAGAPVGVPAANILGGLAVGVLAVALLRSGVADRWGPLLITGFLGGFTTFSAFSLDVVTLFEQGRAETALAYAAVNLVGAVGAAALGAALARSWLGA